MKKINTISALHAHFAETQAILADAETLQKIPLERLEAAILSGKTVVVPETEDEENAAGTDMMGCLMRSIASKRGWKAAARHSCHMADKSMSRSELASYARFLRKKFGRAGI